MVNSKRRLDVEKLVLLSLLSAMEKILFISKSAAERPSVKLSIGIYVVTVTPMLFSSFTAVPDFETEIPALKAPALRAGVSSAACAGGVADSA